MAAIRSHVSLAVLVGFSLALSACGPNIKLPSPLSERRTDAKIQQPVAVHVSPAARGYEDSGWINVVRYHVAFGDSLEANVTDAYARAFSDVEVVDQFPPTGPKAPRLAF